MILKKLKRPIVCGTLSLLLIAQKSIGNDEIKILETGDCVDKTTVGLSHSLFADYQTCCEQRDALQVALTNGPPHVSEGILTKSVYGDIAISFGAGLLTAVLIRELSRNPP